MKNAIFIPVAVFALCARAYSAETVDFAKSVAPIFASRCLDCHGPDKQKADLRLDQKTAAMDPELKAIVAGKPDQSTVFQRVSLPADHDDIMPPKGEPLTKEQVELIKKWITEGAVWPDGIVVGTEPAKGEKPAASGAKKTAGQDFSKLTPTTDAAAEEAAIKKLAELGISVRPIAQNLQWKEASVRPQDPSKASEAVALLKDIPSLVDLNLARLDLKDDDLKHISGLKNLLRLHLENNPITGAGLAHVKDLVNLEYLNLYNTQVGDAGLDNLKNMKNLAALYLWQSKVTDDGVAALKASLPDAMINRGEQLTILAKTDENASEQKAETK